MKQFLALTTWAGDGQSLATAFVPQICVDFALTKFENTADQPTPQLPPTPNLLIGRGECDDPVFESLLFDTHYYGALLWFETFDVQQTYAVRSFVSNLIGPDATYQISQTQSDIAESDRPCDQPPTQNEFDALRAYLLAHGADQATIDSVVGTSVGTRTRAQIASVLSDWVKMLTKE